MVFAIVTDVIVNVQSFCALNNRNYNAVTFDCKRAISLSPLVPSYHMLDARN